MNQPTNTPNPAINNQSQAPCFLCGNIVDIKYSKRQKPYLVCNPCGVQIFVRGKNGISLLEKWKNAPINQNHTASETTEVMRLVDQLEKLKISLQKAENDRGGFRTIISENPVEEAISAEIRKIENRLRELAENN